MSRGISVPKTQEKYVSLQQAAAYFGVSEITIRRWITGRRVPAYRVKSTGTIRCRISEMESALLEPVGKGS